MKINKKIILGIVFLNMLTPFSLAYACVGEKSFLGKNSLYIIVLIAIIINFLIIRRIKKKITLILFIILFNLFAVFFWFLYNIMTATLCV